MRLPSTSSPMAFRFMMLLAVIYAIVGGVEIWRTTQSATYNREVFPERGTAPLEGSMVVEYEFAAQHTELEGLWVFFTFQKGAAEEGNLMLSLRRVEADTPFWTQSFACKQAAFLKPGFLCRVGGLPPLEKGARYVLTYAMPEMKPGTGWRLSYTTLPKATSTVCWDGKVRPSSEPSQCWLEKTPRYPIRNILAGAFLLGLCSLAARETTRFYIPATLIAAVACILSATYYWQDNLWHFWGNFWPDGYVGVGHNLYEYLSGHLSFGESLNLVQHNRTGQVLALPLVMAVFQVIGFSVKGAFLAANGFFLALAAGALLALLRLFGVTGDRATIAAMLVFFSHRCVIGGVSEFQSDLAGTSVTMCFVYTLVRALVTTEPRAQWLWYGLCGVAGFVCCLTRLALLTLALIPACLFLWSLVCERQRPLRVRAAYLVPTAVAVALLGVCWTGLGLWGTVQLNWAFASTFTYLFVWKEFFRNAFYGLQWGLLVILIFGRRLFSDRALVAVVGSAAGLLAMLIYSQQPTWLRYFDPIAGIGVLLLVWPLQAWPRWQGAFLALAWVGAVANVFIP